MPKPTGYNDMKMESAAQTPAPSMWDNIKAGASAAGNYVAATARAGAGIAVGAADAVGSGTMAAGAAIGGAASAAYNEFMKETADIVGGPCSSPADTRSYPNAREMARYNKLWGDGSFKWTPADENQCRIDLGLPTAAAQTPKAAPKIAAPVAKKIPGLAP